MPTFLPVTTVRTTPHLLVRRMLTNLAWHPVWQAYSLASEGAPTGGTSPTTSGLR